MREYKCLPGQGEIMCLVPYPVRNPDTLRPAIWLGSDMDLNPARTSHLVALSRAIGPEIGATSSRTSSGPQNTQRTPSATARGAPGATNTALRSSPV